MVPPVKAVVTGGAGFIGSHLVDALAARGDEVLVLDDFSSGKRENLAGALESGAAVMELDVADAQAMFAAVGAYPPETVFHLAAQIDVRRSIADPGFDARLNVVGTVNALEAATRAGAAQFVFTSTGGAIYGEGADRADELPFAETARCEPFSVYGQSKLAAEGYIDLYARTRGLSASHGAPGQRLRAPAGPCDRGGRGGDLLRGGAGRRPAHRLRHGEQTRDYVYVADVVAALIAAPRPRRRPDQRRHRVETSVLRLAELVGTLRARRLRARVRARPRGRDPADRARHGPAAERLGWRAERTIEAGFEQTIAADA